LINELNKQYHDDNLKSEQVSSIYEYRISESTNPSLYFVKNQKGAHQTINVKYVAVPVSEIVQDFLNIDDLNFINQRTELDTILLNVEAKSTSRKLTYSKKKTKIIEDIQQIYDFSISKEQKYVDVYNLILKDSVLLKKAIENTKGGGVVTREYEVHKIIRLNLSELAHYFQKRLGIHIEYNGDDVNKYNFVLKDFKNINQLNTLIMEHGLNLQGMKSEIEFIVIN